MWEDYSSTTNTNPSPRCTVFDGVSSTADMSSDTKLLISKAVRNAERLLGPVEPCGFFLLGPRSSAQYDGADHVHNAAMCLTQEAGLVRRMNLTMTST